MRVATVTLCLLGAFAALAIAPGATASPCTTTDDCVGACAFVSSSCDNDGDNGNLVCAFDGVPFASACVPYFDCPPKTACHPQYGFGAEVYCDLTTGTCTATPNL